MGEFLGALVAIPLSTRLRIVCPYEDMAWLISAIAIPAICFVLATD
jgi:hypothetical protein